MDYMEKIKYQKHIIEIFQDENPENPREWDNICVFHISHRDYAFGDINYDSGYNSGKNIIEVKEKAKKNGDIVLPLYMYDHSGIGVSLSNYRYPFNCPWDNGIVGFVIIPKKKMISEFGKKTFTKNLKEKALEIAESEVKILNMYLSGDIYGYTIDDDKDSCWGFYGIDETIEEAKLVVDYIVEKNKKEHINKLKIWIKNKVPFIYRTSVSI